MDKPRLKPTRPNFGSGPCEKRPGYALANLRSDVLGRSHRSALGRERLRLALTETRRLLGVPADYRIALVPASDTGAFELAMWNLLGPRPVHVLSWESFGEGWATDIVKHLGLKDVRHVKAPYGELPSLEHDPAHDLVFTWNGTTSGVKVPSGAFISDAREGLTLCDATSAVFAMELPWPKLDVVTFSWQKVLGGEGGHGMLVLSPRAVERLTSYRPPWPLPKIFRLLAGGKLNEELFDGSPINTPSMLANEDYLDALAWAESIGGLPALIARSQNNLAVLERFVADHTWARFLAVDPETRSSTSVCLSVDLTPAEIKRMTALLEAEAVAYDIGSYKEAPPGLRIWCGATVEEENLARLVPWLAWAYHEVKGR